MSYISRWLLVVSVILQVFNLEFLIHSVYRFTCNVISSRLDISNCISVFLSVLDRVCTELRLSRTDSHCHGKYLEMYLLKHVSTCWSIQRSGDLAWSEALAQS